MSTIGTDASREVAASLPRRAKAATTALGILSAVAVPFVGTVLFRLGLPTSVVGILLLGSAGALAAIPRRGPWLALGWLIGLVLYVALLLWLLVQMGKGMESFD